jgi:hypothetical protein
MLYMDSGDDAIWKRNETKNDLSYLKIKKNADKELKTQGLKLVDFWNLKKWVGYFFLQQLKL